MNKEDFTTVYLQGRYDEREKWKNLIKDMIEQLNIAKKEILKGMKGQDRYAVKLEYQFKKNILEELLIKSLKGE